MDTRNRGLEIVNPERLSPGLAEALAGLDRNGIVRRIGDRDPRVWKPGGREISDRLGWLDAPGAALEEVPDLEAFAASIRSEGFVRAVVLGMGGSSLAPEVFARSFPTTADGLELEILDTTEPGAVAGAAARLDLRQTLFIVSSKSGSTAELVALLSFFYARAVRALGESAAGSRFVAVTDPASPLEALAGPLGFRRVFPGRPDIGGRFSALSVFGLLPAALKGVDLRRLLASAQAMSAACQTGTAAENPGVWLGAIMGSAALRGMDKLTLFLPPRLDPLGAWLEQLVAESTGKEGRGILPVLEADPDAAARDGRDRLFVEFTDSLDEPPAPGLLGVAARGLPLVRIALGDRCALGGQFFLWEFATAVAGHLLGINPFDQPDVESTKKKTREILGAAAAEGYPSVPADRGPAATPLLRIPGPGQADVHRASVRRFLDGRRDGDYVALLAFLPRTDAVEEGLAGVARRLRLGTRLPVTIGFGPRYLHSTGQLHKGDGNRGVFFVLVPAELPSAPIPAVPGVARPAADFADLFRAQAWGDRRALEEKGRRVLAVELGSPLERALGVFQSVVA